MQATSIGLPIKALREALVNAIMHRSYREHRPTQIIRYDNRIEIINPGYSLKSEECLGTPGSETRNPIIAALFHETNLAETKGSGIRAMRRLMQEAHLAPPTFESNRTSNQFVVRLLLHHFLGADDIEWLSQYQDFELIDSQKQALIFVREVGAIDNQTYRQMADCDIIKSSIDLRQLKSWGLLSSKGKGKATYYVAGVKINTQPQDLNTQPHERIPAHLQNEIRLLKKKERNCEKIKMLVKEVCSLGAFSAHEIAQLFNRREDYTRNKYLKDMILNKELTYLYPEMINHPEQAYIANQ